MAKAKTYEIDEAVLAETQVKSNGQAQLIINSLVNKHPVTAQQIADDIKARLTTRQDPLRVVSFYLSTWKKSGLVKVVGVAEGESPVSTGNRSSAPAPRDNEQEAPVADDPYADDSEEPVTEEAAAEFDYVNTPLSEAVAKVLERFDDPATPKMISDELNVLGRTVSPKQVSDAVRRLFEKGKLKKVEDRGSVVHEYVVGGVSAVQ